MEATSKQVTVADVLQAELDVLTQKHDGILHPVLQRSNDLATAIQRAAAGDDNTDVSGLYDEEIINSYHELNSLNAVLEDRIQAEQRKLESLESVLEEHQEIHRLLATLQQEQSESKTDTSPDGIERNRTNDQLLEENAKLREDLKYVTDCIEKQREGDDDEPSTLHDLLLELIDRRSDCPEDPYIDRSTVETNPLDLQLLRDAWMIETYKDTDLVCLIDYTATETAS
jgi:hypothetical protein